jgi:nucleotide-binding universal stress UspA family protein
MNTRKRPTILVGVSGSPASAAALRWADEEAQRRHSQLRIVLIWHPEQRAFYARPSRGNEPGEDQEQAQRSLTETVRAVLGHGLQSDATAEVMEGIAERELVAASAAADLLVLGSGSGGSIGPVVRTCLTHAHCPVVVVTPESQKLHRRYSRLSPQQPPDPDDGLARRDWMTKPLLRT